MGHLWSALRVDQQGPLCGLFKELSRLPEEVGRRRPHASPQLSDSPQPALLPFGGPGCPFLICPAGHTSFKRVSLSPHPHMYLGVCSVPLGGDVLWGGGLELRGSPALSCDLPASLGTLSTPESYL